MRKEKKHHNLLEYQMFKNIIIKKLILKGEFYAIDCFIIEAAKQTMFQS